MEKVFVGTSGFLYTHWIGNFYPENLKRDELLKFYSKHFKTVEINSSFYHLPRQKTVVNWLKQVPKNFIFTFKIPRFVSHFGKLDPKIKSFKLFFDAINPLALSPPKHLVLIQTPPSFKVNLKKLTNFLKHLPSTFLYAFEFRHNSWFCQQVYQIFKEYNAAIVLSDSPIKLNSNISKEKSLRKLEIGNYNRLWPYVNINTASFFYIRFHGSQRLFSSSYSDEELKFYAQLIKEKLKKKMTVYCYFNNDAEGAAVFDGKRLIKFLSFTP